MLVHTDEKPFTCSACNAAFSQEYSLEIHMQAHTAEKPFTCSLCQAKFSQEDNLKSHLRLHTVVNPLACSLCLEEFTHPSSLESHMQVHSDEKPLSVCPSVRLSVCPSVCPSHPFDPFPIVGLSRYSHGIWVLGRASSGRKVQNRPTKVKVTVVK